ncbi:MAG: LON peptidase substrate-binding domain-containing protein [Planctomycetota bacterium]
MSAEEQTIHVNFSRPMPLFPLDSVALLPQQVIPLHIFEPRYRQLAGHALDAAGQIAMATYKGQDWKQEYHGNPPLRQAVCVGQIVEHEALPDGRFNILLQGVCRARIEQHLMPDETHQYRRAVLEPLGREPGDPEALDMARERIDERLSEGPLTQVAGAEEVLRYVRNSEVPTPALLELVAFALLKDAPTRYRLLAEGDPGRRCDLIERRLDDLERLIRQAQRQHPEDWPRGCSWN